MRQYQGTLEMVMAYNLGGATCADVLALCDEVRAIVKEKTGYDLEKEIRVVAA